MSEPVARFIRARGLRFRTLTWGDGDETVLLLHGLTGVAEVWEPTVDHLPRSRRYVAMDQRGHGQSSAPPEGYTANHMAADARAVIRTLGGRVHLVGHSMGARVAMLLAARTPGLLRSVAVVDIGPEASRANIASTVRGIEGRPERFVSREAALAFAFRSREPSRSDERIFLARMLELPDGSLTWRAPREALVACVRSQRSLSYWKDWRKIAIPALYVHGGASAEVSTAIADRMRRENPRVKFERFDGLGHNIPLIAPGQLAMALQAHWTTGLPADET